MKMNIVQTFSRNKSDSLSNSSNYISQERKKSDKVLKLHFPGEKKNLTKSNSQNNNKHLSTLMGPNSLTPSPLQVLKQQQQKTPASHIYI